MLTVVASGLLLLTQERFTAAHPPAREQRSTPAGALETDVARVAVSEARPLPTRAASRRDTPVPAAMAGAESEPAGGEVPFDLSAVIDRVHFAFRPTENSSVLEGGHSTYGVRVEAETFEVRAYRAVHDERPADEPVVASPPVSFATVALGRGTPVAELAEQPGVAARVADDGHATWTRHDHVEHLRNGSEGVEQSWSFASRPRGQGDLLVRVAAEGLPMVGVTQHGLHFADASGLGVRYGHAVWVAADGTRTRVRADWRDHAIELRVPARVVDESTYPAVLDPIVGPEVGVDEPLSGVAPMDQRSPAIAWNGTHYLAVWQDLRGGATADIRGARLTSAGVVVDTRGIVICSAANDQTLPSVASNGADFLVVWEDRRVGPTRDIHGARVTGAGVVQDLSGIAISTAPNEQQAPSVASNGTDYLVVWEDARGTPNWDVYGARVTSAGVVEDASGVLLGAVPGNQRTPDVASNGTEYFVVWHENRAGTSNDVYGTRVTAGGDVLDLSGVAISASAGNQQSVSIASNGTDYFVAWMDSRGITNDAYGSRVTAAGSVLDPSGLVVSAATGHQQYPTVASDGTDYLVTWTDLRANRDIYAGRVTSAGVSLDGGGIPVYTHWTQQQSPVVASDGTGYLAVWQDNRGGTIPDIYGARISAAGVLLDTDGFAVSLDENAQREAAVASNGDGYLVVWEDGRSGRFEDIYGVRLNAAGDVVDPAGLAISTAANRQGAPAVASDGTDYLVVWEDFRDANSDQIYGARVTSEGVQETEGIPIAVAVDSSSQSDPAVASNGSNYFVAWIDTRLENLDLFGARVSLAGQVLDPNGILVAAVPTEAQPPAIASDGTDYLVVWSHERAYPEEPTHDIYGTRVSGAGMVLQPSAFFVSNATNHQLNPAVASNGTSYMVVWDDFRGGTYDVYGTRVTLLGQALDPLGIAISRVVDDQQSPAVASSGTGYRVVWQDHRDGLVWRIYGADVTSSGAVSGPANGYLIHDGGKDSESPAIAEGATGETIVAYQRADDVVARMYTRLLTSGTVGLPDGTACSLGTDCGSGYCVDSVCCNTACGGGSNSDCQACAATLTGGSNGTCGPVLAATPCGDGSTSPCNAPDTCDGAGACQPNLAPANSPCGDSSNNACTAADTCNAVGVCRANHHPTGSACEAGLFCSSGDSCNAGTCGEGSFSPCSASEKCSEALDQCYPACGDGVQDPGEGCDTGGQNSDTTPNACRTDCRVASCGDGVQDTGEGCDEGALNADEQGATCRTTCALATCGDGISDPGEACDEGALNADTPDAPCRTTCTLPDCGDGVQDTGEACDNGALNSDVAMDACRTACVVASCGDGVQDTGEECDDGPTGSLICSTACEVQLLDAGVSDDMGMDAAVDAGADAGDDGGAAVDSALVRDIGTEVDAGTALPRGGGCGCHVPTTVPSGNGLPLGVALLLALGAVQRRIRRR